MVHDADGDHEDLEEAEVVKALRQHEEGVEEEEEEEEEEEGDEDVTAVPQPSKQRHTQAPKPKPKPPKSKAKAKAKLPVALAPAAEPEASSSGRPSRVAASKAAQLAKRLAAEDEAGSGSDYEDSEEGAEGKDDGDDDASVSSDYDDDSGSGAKRRRGAGGASKAKPAAKAKGKPAAKGGLPTSSARAKAGSSQDDGKFTLDAKAGQPKGGKAGKAAKPVGASVVVSVKLPNPPKQPTQPFVDPAGLDIEDRGVEWIVETQCPPRPAYGCWAQ